MTGEIEVIDGAIPPELVQTLDQVVRMPIWKHGVKSGMGQFVDEAAYAKSSA